MATAALQITPAEDPPAYDYPSDIENAPFKGWDNKIFAQELVRKHIAPNVRNISDDDVATEVKTGAGQFDHGTWGGTQLALTEMHSRVEQAYSAFFEATGLETSIPLNIINRNDLYEWSTATDKKYPPHLALIPKDREVALTELFNKLGLAEAAIMLANIVPKNFIGRTSERLLERFRAVLFGENDDGASFADLEHHNSDLFRRRTATDIMQGKNIGDLPDWWSDARFAQQYLTGTNPTTLTLAGPVWIERFRKVAEARGTAGKNAAEFLHGAESGSLYVQDYSYYRQAVGAASDAELSAGSGAEKKYCAAPVALFHLAGSGQLHPIAIVVDYNVDMSHSVTIFNQRLSPVEPGSAKEAEILTAEKHDWPWRYAKQVVQMADWCLHEIVVHLTWTHLLEEATIVAANRAFGVQHPVFRLLEPHWFRTLPINAGARNVLVPSIIFELVGLKDDQPYDFIKYHYNIFNWTERYIPNDLERRGFPIQDLDCTKFRNCAYARNMILIWNCIRDFVEKMLHDRYPYDRDVADDSEIAAWCQECQTNAQIPSFPTIKTRTQLFDAVTMCIHIASPQHTAINYLQNYYQAFVPSKPPALYTPPTASLEQLGTYVEADLLRSLPVGHQRDWLLAAHIPWLLSFKTAKESSLLEYTISLYNSVRKSSDATDRQTKAIASQFYAKLLELGKVFERHSDEMTKGTIPYTVMNPATTAVSILL